MSHPDLVADACIQNTQASHSKFREYINKRTNHEMAHAVGLREPEVQPTLRPRVNGRATPHETGRDAGSELNGRLSSSVLDNLGVELELLGLAQLVDHLLRKRHGESTLCGQLRGVQGEKSDVV